MDIYVLHNRHDQMSREFVARLQADPEPRYRFIVIDWYAEGVAAAFKAAGGFIGGGPGVFPSLTVPLPDHLNTVYADGHHQVAFFHKYRLLIPCPDGVLPDIEAVVDDYIEAALANVYQIRGW